MFCLKSDGGGKAQFHHSVAFNEHLLLPGIILDAGDINKVPSLKVFTFWGRDKQLTNTKIYKALPGGDKC